MTINENQMNPIPLWDNKNKWQCNSKTFHDAMAWPVVQNGVLPAMALTLAGTPASSTSNVSLVVSNNSIISGTYATSDLTAAFTENDDANFTSRSSSYEIKFTHAGNNAYTIDVSLNSGGTMTLLGDITDLSGHKEVSRAAIRAGGNFLYNGNPVTLSPLDLNFKYEAGDKTLLVKRFSDNVQVADKTASFVIRGCVPYKSSERVGRMWIDAGSITGVVPDGVYYIEFTFDDVTYYSEPFVWMTSLFNYTHVTFRRSGDIVTKTNVIIFDDGEGNSKQLAMYLRNIDQRPPYQFNPEVTDIDGRKFAEKQVSYYNRRIAFNCYETFLEAIRLLWHCDIRNMGNRRIDYMEPPEMDWGTDNHLCDVVLEMSNYDDVLQTNGTASSYFDSSDSDHQAYDASFDASFN